MEFIYITCKNQKEAEKIAKALLSKNLIGCANILPSVSLYHWKKKLKKKKESILICKTFGEKFSEIERVVKKLHSYEIPLIASLDVEDVNPEFNKWLEKEVR